MELRMIDGNGKPGAKLQASDELFGREYNEALVHQVVVAYQANARLFSAVDQTILTLMNMVGAV